MTQRNNLNKALSYLPKSTAGRVVAWLLTAGVIAFQAYEQLPSRQAPSKPPAVSTSGTPRPSTASSTVPTRELTNARATKFAKCPKFFAQGKTPVVQDAPALRELCYEAFAVLHSGNTRTPVFVAQRLNRKLLQAAKGQKRTDKFFADARLPMAERATPSDYKNAKVHELKQVSKGHMAPAGDMPNPTAMEQSFSLANMVPQEGQHNSGAWKKIETDTRQYALRAKGDVFVITGPIFSDTSRPTIGKNEVHVPSHIFKLVYDAQEQKAWAHWQANTVDVTAGEPISYNELKRRIGMELLPGVPIREN